jgi:hypothetical protein
MLDDIPLLSFAPAKLLAEELTEKFGNSFSLALTLDAK